MTWLDVKKQIVVLAESVKRLSSVVLTLEEIANQARKESEELLQNVAAGPAGPVEQEAELYSAIADACNATAVTAASSELVVARCRRHAEMLRETLHSTIQLMAQLRDGKSDSAIATGALGSLARRLDERLLESRSMVEQASGTAEEFLERSRVIEHLRSRLRARR